MNSPLFIFFFQGQDLVTVTGVAQIQEAADALAATGLVAPALPPGFVQEAPDTLVATGEVAVTGEAAIQEAPDIPAVIPVVGDPAGDDYRRRRLRRGLRPDPVGSPRFSLGQAVIFDELIEAPDGRKQVHQP
jgi:hypothetical protein